MLIHSHFLLIFAQELIGNNVGMRWKMTKLKTCPLQTIGIPS